MNADELHYFKANKSLLLVHLRTCKINMTGCYIVVDNLDANGISIVMKREKEDSKRDDKEKVRKWRQNNPEGPSHNSRWTRELKIEGIGRQVFILPASRKISTRNNIFVKKLVVQKIVESVIIYSPVFKQNFIQQFKNFIWIKTCWLNIGRFYRFYSLESKDFLSLFVE